MKIRVSTHLQKVLQKQKESPLEFLQTLCPHCRPHGPGVRCPAIPQWHILGRIEGRPPHAAKQPLSCVPDGPWPGPIRTPQLHEENLLGGNSTD